MTYDATNDSIHSTYVLPFTIAALAVIAYGLVAMILFWRNRTIQPIKSRSPGFVLFSQFIMLLWVVQLIIQRTLPNSIPCWINTLLNHLILGVIIDCYLIRLFTLHFAYAVMKEMMESERGRQGRSEAKRATVPLSVNITTTAPSSPNTSHNTDSAPSPSSHTNTNPYYSYTANKHWIAPRTLAMMMCVAIIIQMIPSSIYVATRKTTWNTMTGDITCSDTTNNIILLCMMLCYCSIFIYGAYRLRTVVDAFVIKKELAISGYSVLVTAVLWFAIGQIIPDLTSEEHITTYILITNVTAILTVSLMMPWYKTYLYTSITSQQMEMSQCTSTSKPVKHLTLFPIKKDEPARFGTKSSVSSTEIRSSNPSPALSQRPLSSPPSSFSVSVPIQQRVLTTRNSSLSSPILMATTTPSNDITSFSKLLRHEAGIEAFRSFLCLEFSVENLLMWEECGLFVQCGRTKLSLLTSSRTITEEEEPPMDMSPLLKLMTDVAIVVPSLNLDGDVNETPSHELHGISIQVDATTPTTAARRISTSITSATPKRMSIFPQGYRQNLFSEYGTEVHEQPIPSHVDVDPSTHPSTITNNITSTTSHEDEHQKPRHSSISLVGEIHKDTNQNVKNEMLAFDIHAGALRIFNKYIRRGSPYEVNLSHQVIEMVSSRLQISSPHGEMASPLAVQEQTVIVDAIQSAQDTIYRLMKTDSYLRFTASKQYQDLIRNLTQPISS